MNFCSIFTHCIPFLPNFSLKIPLTKTFLRIITLSIWCTLCLRKLYRWFKSLYDTKFLFFTLCSRSKIQTILTSLWKIFRYLTSKIMISEIFSSIWMVWPFLFKIWLIFRCTIKRNYSVPSLISFKNFHMNTIPNFCPKLWRSKIWITLLNNSHSFPNIPILFKSWSHCLKISPILSKLMVFSII